MEEPLSLGEVEEVTENSVHQSPVLSLREDRQSPNPELVVLNVEVADGLQGNIYVHEKDDPYQLAAEFADKYHLQPSVQADLANLIIQNKATAQRNLRGDSPPLVADPSTKPEWSIFASSDPEFQPKIDARSRSIAEKNQRAGPVYERLYLKGKKKSPDPAPSPPAHLSSSYNYGEWQYLRGIQLKESVIRSKAKLKKELDEETFKETPFKPEINRYSSLLSPRFDARVEDLLMTWGSSHEQKLEQMRTQQTTDDSKECTFKPEVNPKSVTLAQKKKREITGPKFQELYQQATQLRKREEIEYADLRKSEYSFHPNSKGRKKATETHEEFLNRLVNSKKSIEERLNAQRKEKEDKVTIDESTGQEFFRPSVRRKKNEKSSRTEPIHQYLYNLRNSKDENRQKAQESLGERGIQTAPQLTDKTQQAFMRYQQNRIATLFSMLDSDRDGRISTEQIDLSVLDEKQQSVLIHVLEDLSQAASPWDYDTFSSKIEELLPSLTVEDRHYILKRDKKSDMSSVDSESFHVTFTQPKLTAKTHVLAQKKRATEPGDIYSRGMMSVHQSAELREASKAAKEEEEMKHCTFNPFKVVEEESKEKKTEST